MEKQVTILFAGTQGFLDKLPVEALGEYEAGLYTFIEERYPKVFSELAEKQEITDDIKNMLKEALNAYGEEFAETLK
jgi:F-type H+-transporting ATPase subunit alpha